MPSTEPRAGHARKGAVVASIVQELGRSQAFFLTDFRGLDVATMTRLRRRVKESQAAYKVAKNTLIKRALAQAGLDGGLDPLLQGPTGLCFAYGDPVVVARLLNEMARETRLLSIKGGWLQGRVLSPQDVEALAQLPPREVLLAQVLGTLQAPISGLAGALGGILRKLVVALDQIRQKKEGAQQAA